MARTKRKQHHSTHHSTRARHAPHGHGHENGRQDAERMVTVGRERIDHMQKSARSAFDVFSGPMARVMDHNFSLFQKTMQAMQEESLNFFNRRLEHTTHIIENSRDFQGVSGLMQLQQEWVLELARDYSEQATRFAQLMRDIAVDSTERFAEASTEAMERAETEIEDEEEEYGSAEGAHRAAA